MCIKHVFSAKQRVLAHLTTFLLNNAFESKEMLVSALVGLNVFQSMLLHFSQCFHCVKVDNVHKTRF